MRHALGFLLATLVATGAVRHASAQEVRDPDIRDVRPAVMLLVDTSGSMERMSGGSDAPLPQCSGASSGTNDHNRWSAVVEAMTGTWNESDYYCTRVDRSAYTGFEDHNYYLPYHRPPFAVPQNNDGILDVYADRIKFGLMTFDATYTYIDHSHPLLMRRAAFEARHPVQNHANFGGYSYGEPRVLRYEGCADEFMVDSGARNSASPNGALISVGLESDDHRLINQRIQAQLASVRPFGGTPTAALLQDFQYYLDRHPDVTTADPYSECRVRTAILLTDGQPDRDFRDSRYNCEVSGGACPYERAAVTADALCNYSSSSSRCTGDLDQLFVVAVDVNDPAALAELNAIADAGGTGAALLAGDRDELVRRLAEALDRSAPGNTTRSRPAFVVGGSTFSAGSAAAQLEFNAGFRVGTAGEPWSGVLERTRYLCNAANEPEAEDVADRVRFDQILNTNDSRTLYTVTTANPADMKGNLVGTQATGAPLNATPATGVVNDVELRTFDASIAQEYFGIPALDTSGPTRRDAIVAWVRGQTPERDDRRMGDIYHSSPVAVSPPRIDIADESYNLFRARPGVADRPTVLYVGTNDGVLHAFAAEDWTNGSDAYSAGDEIWGFVPPVLMSKLESATISHQIMVDGTPVVRDVFFSRVPGSSPDGRDYHTVLTMGFRAGGRGYFALDVTDPLTPTFLWQYVGEPDSVAATSMGNSYGTPALGQALVEVDGVLQERAIAVLPGGEGDLDLLRAVLNGPSGCPVQAVTPQTTAGTSGPRTSVRCWESRGRVLTVLDVATGEIIRDFDASHFNSPLTGGVSLYPGDIGTIAQRVVLTDADGVLWTADLRLRDPGEWETRALHDIFWGKGATEGQPAYAPPTLSSDPSGQLVVVQATGDIDRLDGLGYNRVVSVTEVVDFGTPGAFEFSSELNWEINLLEGEQVTGAVELFEGTAFFATFESGSDPLDFCALGQSRIWGVDYLEAGAPPPNSADGVYTDPLGGYFPQPRYPEAGNQVHFIGPSEFADRLVLGVGITQRPTCVIGTNISDPYIGSRFQVNSVGGGQFQLTAQMSGRDTTGAGGAIETTTQSLEAPASFTTVQGFAGQVDY